MVRSEQKYEIRNTRYEIRNDVEMCGTADVRPSAYVGILDDHFYLYTLRQAQCRAFIFCIEWLCWLFENSEIYSPIKLFSKEFMSSRFHRSVESVLFENAVLFTFVFVLLSWGWPSILMELHVKRDVVAHLVPGALPSATNMLSLRDIRWYFAWNATSRSFL